MEIIIKVPQVNHMHKSWQDEAQMIMQKSVDGDYLQFEGIISCAAFHKGYLF